MNIATACSLVEINTAKCDTACRVKGYSSGFYKKGCACVDDKGSMNEFITGRVSGGLTDPKPIARARRPNETGGAIYWTNSPPSDEQ